jgi:crotonobetainyl-CoA:carnitine CoA-transferase CaiB-like acyl-CoA transferase
VLDWDTLVEHPQFGLLQVVQTVERGSGSTYETTVCPIRVDGHKLTASLGSCALGEHNAQIDGEFDLR